MIIVRHLTSCLCSPIAAGTLFSTLVALFGTVAVGRVLGLTQSNSLMLSQRCTSGGFAMLVCTMLNAPVAIMFMFNLASGLFGGCLGQLLLDKLGLRNDRSSGERICRGIAMGSSSHATGTASLIQSGEEETAAIASVSVVVCGVLHTVFCSAPPVRRLLLALASGGAGGG